MFIVRNFALVLMAAALCVFTGCGDSSSSSSGGSSSSTGGSSATPVASGPVKLVGAGASFPAPLYEQWFKDYSAKHPNITIDYQSVGSGSGIKQFIEGTTDFGASDAAMKPEEIDKVEGGVYLLPMTAGAVVLAYNVPGVTELKLPQDVYVDMFLGKITNWNDARIAKANPGVNLPDMKINIAHRADGSGTTYVFTQHLSAISDAWKNGPGTGKKVDWPTGVGAPKNDGVTAAIKQTPGTIGYIEYGYSMHAGLPVAALQNKSGNFIKPGPETSAAALASAVLPENLIAWETNPAGKDAYPIVSFTWILAHTSYKPETGKVFKDMIEYCLTDGQKISDKLGYIPLPQNVVDKVRAKVNLIKFSADAAH